MDPLRRQVTSPRMDRVLKVINLIRLMEAELPAQVVATYFYVASRDGCHKRALEEDLGLTPASGSRNTDWLSKQHRLGRPGLDLIAKEEDPTYRRRLQLKLTDKGKRLIKQIEDILYGD